MYKHHGTRESRNMKRTWHNVNDYRPQRGGTLGKRGNRNTVTCHVHNILTVPRPHTYPNTMVHGKAAMCKCGIVLTITDPTRSNLLVNAVTATSHVHYTLAVSRFHKHFKYYGTRNNRNMRYSGEKKKINPTSIYHMALQQIIIQSRILHSAELPICTTVRFKSLLLTLLCISLPCQREFGMEGLYHMASNTIALYSSTYNTFCHVFTIKIHRSIPVCCT